MEEIVQMPKCHHIVMQLEYRNRRCQGKSCYDRCLDYACPINAEELDEGVLNY